MATTLEDPSPFNELRQLMIECLFHHQLNQSVFTWKLTFRSVVRQIASLFQITHELTPVITIRYVFACQDTISSGHFH